MADTIIFIEEEDNDDEDDTDFDLDVEGVDDNSIVQIQYERLEGFNDQIVFSHNHNHQELSSNFHQISPS